MSGLEQFRDPELDTSGERVGIYEREFYVFSNFSSFQVEWRDQLWPTSEHAYHAAKFWGNDDLVEAIRNTRSAHDAFKLAREFSDEVAEDWEEVKIDVMTDICREKLYQHEYIQKKLLQTGDLEIVEDSPKDDFWGWGPNRDGKNALGKIWMELRDELKSS